MSEPMFVSIDIGGKIRKKNLKKFIDSINRSDMVASWGERSLRISNQTQLLSLLDKNKNIHLVDGERNWGDIDEFEDELKDLCLTYKVWIGQTEEYMGQIKFWEPGQKLIDLICDDKGFPIANNEDLQKILDKMRLKTSDGFHEATSMIKVFLDPYRVPPLEIV